MTTLKADSKGVVKGSFVIPARQPAGTYDVSVEGALGSNARTAFTGQGTRTVTRVQTIITSTLTSYQRYDPLAQTFTLDRDTYLGAVEFWVVEGGNAPLTVDIRTCENGIPTQTILRRARLEVDEVTNLNNNQPTRAAFDPVRLTAGTEYCFVILSDDPDWTVETATLGEYDKRADKWITAQAFQIGTLLSSSNASTWTPHQKKDMRFRLLEAVFSTTVRNYSLGTFDLYNADLIHAQFTADRVDDETDAVLILTLPDGKTTYRLKEDTVASLSDKVTGKAQLKMELRGTPNKSPTVLSGLTVVSSGALETGEYTTKHINLGDNVDVRVTFDAAVGPSSSVKAYYSTGNSWTALPLTGQINLGDGFNERQYMLKGISGDTIRIKLVLQGTAKDAPRVRKFRVVTI